MAAARSPIAIPPVAPAGSVAPSRIAPTNCRAMSQRPKCRNGRLTCGDAVDIIAVAMTNRPGGKTGGPLLSNSNSMIPRSSSIRTAAAPAASRIASTGAAISSRARAHRRRASAANSRMAAHTTGVQKAKFHSASRKSGNSATTSEIDSLSDRNTSDAVAASNATIALPMARTTSVGRRDRASSCADAKSWMPSVRLALGVTTVAGPDMRRMLGARSAPDGDRRP
jgi:hypothetical protein